MITRTTRGRRRFVTTAMLSAAVAGGGAGAAIYSSTGGSPSATTATATARSTQIASRSSSLTVGQIYSRNSAGVVEVDVTTTGAQGPFGGTSTEEAQGTGFVFDKLGHIVTNEHVIEGAASITVKLSNGSSYKATVVGSDASTDVAVLRISAPASALHPLTFGDSSTVSVGDEVVAIGDPFGLDDTVTTGIVSAVGRTITSPDNSAVHGAIQTDAAINHGNSGGPLFNSAGRVIGVNAQIESSSGGSDGVGFAIPSNLVQKTVQTLLAGEQ